MRLAVRIATTVRSFSANEEIKHVAIYSLRQNVPLDTFPKTFFPTGKKTTFIFGLRCNHSALH